MTIAFNPISAPDLSTDEGKAQATIAKLEQIAAQANATLRSSFQNGCNLVYRNPTQTDLQFGQQVGLETSVKLRKLAILQKSFLNAVYELLGQDSLTIPTDAENATPTPLGRIPTVEIEFPTNLFPDYPTR